MNAALSVVLEMAGWMSTTELVLQGKYMYMVNLDFIYFYPNTHFIKLYQNPVHLLNKVR